jgi:preprotein translocase subunit SecD
MDTGSGCGSLLATLLSALAVIVGALFFGISSNSPVAVPPTPVVVEAPAANIELVLSPAASRELSADALQATADIYRERLSALGITTIEIDILDQRQVRVRLAVGDLNLDESITPALTQIGFLEFVDFAGLSDDQVTALKDGTVQTTGQLEALGQAIDPAGAVNPSSGAPFTTIATAADVATATPNFGSDSGSFVMTLAMTEAGTEKLRAYTAANIGQTLAIVRDGKVNMAPRVMSEISSAVQISGTFSRDEALALAAQIRTRPLPSRMEVASINVIR